MSTVFNRSREGRWRWGKRGLTLQRQLWIPSAQEFQTKVPPWFLVLCSEIEKKKNVQRSHVCQHIYQPHAQCFWATPSTSLLSSKSVAPVTVLEHRTQPVASPQILLLKIQTLLEKCIIYQGIQIQYSDLASEIQQLNSLFQFTVSFIWTDARNFMKELY